MNEMTHDQLKELIAPYVLGAVDDDERTIVRAHIMSCEECMREADNLSEVTTWLDGGVEAVEVPPGFAEQVLSSVRDQDEPREDATVTPLRRPPAWQWLSAAALIVALLFFSVSWFQTRNDLDFQERVVSALVRGEGMDLHGPTGAVGKMVPSSDGGIFVASGLQRAPDEHTYQLWLIENDEPASAGVFDVRAGAVTLEIDDSLEGVDDVAVTVEPAGGSVAPTSDPIISTG
jgi:anti-sigma-K factor RskA